MSTSFRRHVVDIYNAKRSVHTSKLYIDQLVIHPLKVLLTFTQTPFPRRQETEENISHAMFNILTALVGVDEMELKLNSFIVSGAMESIESLRTRIVVKSTQDITHQLGHVCCVYNFSQSHLLKRIALISFMV